MQLGSSAQTVAELSSALGVLSAMITPAILILASGSLILTTSNRLTRVIDRVRELAGEFEKLTEEQDETARSEEKQTIRLNLLSLAINRARLLQRAITLLYIALSTFVATSVAIGLVALTHSTFAWIALTFGFIGAGLLLWSSFLLIVESRVGLASTLSEMDHIWRYHASPAAKRDVPAG